MFLNTQKFETRCGTCLSFDYVIDYNDYFL